MPRLRLTDIAVQQLKEPGTYIDQTLPSFALRVGKRRKTWIVMRGKERIRIKLGFYPDLRLADARRAAHAAIAAAPAAKASLSFKDARERFLDVHGKALKVRTKKELTRRLTRHFTWQKSLDKITHQDVAAAIDRITAPSEALHAFRDIRTFFRWCVPRYLPHTPCEGLKAPSKYVPRDRVLLDNELLSVWRAADRASYPFGTILKLLIVTGARYGEIAGLRWSNISEREGTIGFPETKNGTAHTLPLGKLAKSIIADVPRRNDTQLLFPGRKSDQAWNGAGKAKWLLEDRPPLRPWTIHDLRRTAATNWAALGVPIHVTERLLNHRSGQTTGGIIGIYQRFAYWDDQVDAITRWEAKLLALTAAT